MALAGVIGRIETTTGPWNGPARVVGIDVRYIGKVGTFVLMTTVPLIAWGHFGLPLGPTATAIGWIFFPIGIIEYYAATAMYVGDIREMLRTPA